jgi:hypothetical protein
MNAFNHNIIKWRYRHNEIVQYREIMVWKWHHVRV